MCAFCLSGQAGIVVLTDRFCRLFAASRVAAVMVCSICGDADAAGVLHVQHIPQYRAAD